MAGEKDENGNGRALANGVRIIAASARSWNWRRALFIALGLGLFLGVYLAPLAPPVVDPLGKEFALSREGKAAIGLFLMAVVWWVSEIMPIGVTAIAIGVIQSLFHIRDSRVVFTDFMDPSVWFIFGSIVIGMAFTRTGLTQRMAYKMLLLVGERTSMIYLGCFAMTGFLTLFMAHTAVAATVYPLFMAIYTLYTEDERPTRFGKGLFIGMAFTAGAGSVVTLLGSARGAVAIGFFRDIAGREIGFFELSYYMAPLGWAMILLLWLFIWIVFRPEKAKIAGLRSRARALHMRLGPMKGAEIAALAIVAGTILLLSMSARIEALAGLNKSAVILCSTVLFFLFRILAPEDLESIPWNIVLLFGGAMSIGYCLWQTGAANWIAVHAINLLHGAPRLVFILGVGFFIMLMTNLIMNVAAIAIFLPVALVVAPYLGAAPELVLYVSLAAAGMPFLFLIGAAPNAIAYSSEQFKAGEFFLAGIPASALLMLVMGVFAALIWPLMGMPGVPAAMP